MEETEPDFQPTDQAICPAWTKAAEYSSCHPLSNLHISSPVINDLVDAGHLKQDRKGSAQLGLSRSPHSNLNYPAVPPWLLKHPQRKHI